MKKILIIKSKLEKLNMDLDKVNRMLGIILMIWDDDKGRLEHIDKLEKIVDFLNEKGIDEYLPFEEKLYKLTEKEITFIYNYLTNKNEKDLNL